MHRVCHRCHAELPVEVDGRVASGSAKSGEDHALFCPRCGAPQILLPEYMRTETAASPAASTTGAVPPPRPQVVDWPAAVLCAAPVAVVTGALCVAGLVVPAASFVDTLCVLGGAGIVLGLYRSRRPMARIDGRVGLRLGLLTGLMMVAGMGLALAGAGVVTRFGTQRMGGFDNDLTKRIELSQQMSIGWAKQIAGQNYDSSAEVQQRNLMNSPEGRAANVLSDLSFRGGAIVLLTTVLGGITGVFQTRRWKLRQGNR